MFLLLRSPISSRVVFLYACIQRTLPQQTVDEARQRELLLRVCNTVLDPMRQHVIVRPDFDLEYLLADMRLLERPIKIKYEASAIRFLTDTSIVHAHLLFILFRLQVCSV